MIDSTWSAVRALVPSSAKPTVGALFDRGVDSEMVARAVARIRFAP
jgi:hypothetical protein